MLKSNNVPQADILADVIKTVEYVKLHKGCTYDSIATHIGKGGRQGRYYRKAAQILGLIDNHRNYAWILDDGESFLKLGSAARYDFLKKRIMDLKVFELTVKLISDNPGCTEDDVYKLLYQQGITDNTAHRRTKSVVNWLVELKVIRWSGDSLFLI